MIQITNNLNFSYKKRPQIIAEISGNHNGSKKKFLNLIKSACLNGADLIKIQTYEPSDITLDKNYGNFKINKGIWKGEKLWNLYKKACTPYSWHKEAFEIANRYKKIIFSSPFSIRAVDLLEKLECKVYKIASFEITDLKLIDYIASKNKPIIISTGMANLNEIKKAIKLINKYHSKIIILHCVSDYPTKIEDMNLERINFLKKKFPKCLIGVSDHTNSIYTSIAATAIGVVLVEKHFKYNNFNTTDSTFSITPRELNEMASILPKIYKAMKIDNKNNEIISKNLRRSIFAKKDIMKNEKISISNIDTYRPLVGMCASNYFKILNRKTNKFIKKDEPIFFKDLT
jgi:pseudaminic acid synthase